MNFLEIIGILTLLIIGISLLYHIKSIFNIIFMLMGFFVVWFMLSIFILWITIKNKPKPFLKTFTFNLKNAFLAAGEYDITNKKHKYIFTDGNIKYLYIPLFTIKRIKTEDEEIMEMFK